MQVERKSRIVFWYQIYKKVANVPGYKYVFPILAILFVVAVIRFPYFSLPLDRDEGAYAYIGWAWLKGYGIPYLSFFDHKPPLAHLLLGLATFIKGNDYLSIRILSFFYIQIIVLFFYIFVFTLTNRISAIFSTLIFGLYISSIELEGSYFNTEIQAILPLLLFVFLMWRMKGLKSPSYLRAIVAGFSGSVSIFFRPVSIYMVFLVILWYFLVKRNLREVFIIFLGFAIPFLVFILYFGSNNALNDAYTDLIYYNRRYIQEGFKVGVLSVGGVKGIIRFLGWFTSVPSVLYCFVGVVIFGLVVSKEAILKIRKPLFFGLLILLSSWAGVKMGSREFPHYYLSVIPGLCIMFALWVKNMINQKKIGMVVFTALILVGWLVFREYRYWISGPLAIQWKQFGSQADWFSDAPKVAKWINQNTKTDDTMWVWANEAEIYFYVGRKNYTKFMNFNGFWYLPEEEKKWYKEFDQNPPTIIITYINDPPTWIELQKFMDRKPIYEKITNIGTYVIFKKR